MKSLPWQDNNIKFRFTTGEFKGYRIEEIRSPWDLMLEAYFMVTNLSDPSHVTSVADGREHIFSIRNQGREPVADIVCMPKNKHINDGYWSKVRILKTSSPMTIDDKELVVLDVVYKSGHKCPPEILELVKSFFVTRGGQLLNEWPLGCTFNSLRDVKKWQKRVNPVNYFNLCIGFKNAYVKECKLQAYDLTQAKKLLEDHIFDEVYLCAEDDWMFEVVSFLKQNPQHGPEKQYWVYGEETKRKKLLDELNKKDV